MIGPNGAGKSTVFKAVFGLLSIHSGTIRLDGQDVTRQSPAQMIAHGVTYVPQGRNVVPNLSVLHNLELGGITAKDQGKVKRRIDEVMDQFPILREKNERAGDRAVRRPAEAARDRPRAAARPEAHPDRRALDRPLAEPGAGGVPDADPACATRASPS